MICPKCNTLNPDINTKCLECNEIFLPRKTVNSLKINEINNNYSSKSNSYSIEYEVSFAEIILSYPYLFFKLNNWKKFALIVAIFITLTNTNFLFRPSITLIIGLFITSFVLFTLVMFTLVMFTTIVTTLIRHKELLSKHIMAYDDTILREINSYNTNEYKWQDVQHIHISNKNIYLRTRKKRVVILPKRIFSSSEYDKFVTFAFEQVKGSSR